MRRTRVAVVAAAPFNSGLLRRTYPASGATFDYGPAPEPELRRARLLAEVSARHGIVLPHTALRFPLRDPGVACVACVVAGFRTPEEVVSAARWAATDLAEEAWPDLDAAAARAAEVPST